MLNISLAIPTTVMMTTPALHRVATLVTRDSHLLVELRSQLHNPQRLQSRHLEPGVPQMAAEAVGSLPGNRVVAVVVVAMAVMVDPWLAMPVGVAKVMVEVAAAMMTLTEAVAAVMVTVVTTVVVVAQSLMMMVMGQFVRRRATR